MSGDFLEEKQVFTLAPRSGRFTGDKRDHPIHPSFPIIMYTPVYSCPSDLNSWAPYFSHNMMVAVVVARENTSRSLDFPPLFPRKLVATHGFVGQRLM